MGELESLQLGHLGCRSATPVLRSGRPKEGRPRELRKFFLSHDVVLRMVDLKWWQTRSNSPVDRGRLARYSGRPRSTGLFKGLAAQSMPCPQHPRGELPAQREKAGGAIPVTTTSNRNTPEFVGTGSAVLGGFSGSFRVPAGLWESPCFPRKNGLLNSLGGTAAM